MYPMSKCFVHGATLNIKSSYFNKTNYYKDCPTRNVVTSLTCVLNLFFLLNIKVDFSLYLAGTPQKN